MCCGNRRAALSRATPPATGLMQAASPMAATPSRITTIVFEYIGAAAPATVTGPASGRVYRFGRSGDRLAVDARDRPGLMAMAGLRWVR